MISINSLLLCKCLTFMILDSATGSAQVGTLPNDPNESIQSLDKLISELKGQNRMWDALGMGGASSNRVSLSGMPGLGSMTDPGLMQGFGGLQGLGPLKGLGGLQGLGDMQSL